MVYDLCLELGETFFLDPDPNQNISDPPHGSLGPSEIIQCSYLVRGASRREATFSGSNSLFKTKADEHSSNPFNSSVGSHYYAQSVIFLYSN